MKLEIKPLRSDKLMALIKARAQRLRYKKKKTKKNACSAEWWHPRGCSLTHETSPDIVAGRVNTLVPKALPNGVNGHSRSHLEGWNFFEQTTPRPPPRDN